MLDSFFILLLEKLLFSEKLCLLMSRIKSTLINIINH